MCGQSLATASPEVLHCCSWLWACVVSWGGKKSFVLAVCLWGQPTPLLCASQLKARPCHAGALHSISLVSLVPCLGATGRAGLEEVSAKSSKRPLVQSEIMEE